VVKGKGRILKKCSTIVTYVCLFITLLLPMIELCHVVYVYHIMHM
jgi:hypothetical protein